MNDKAIELYFNFLGMHDHNLATLETLALDNMELRFKLYGACNSEQGQYMSFVKKTDPNENDAAGKTQRPQVQRNPTSLSILGLQKRF